MDFIQGGHTYIHLFIKRLPVLLSGSFHSLGEMGDKGIKQDSSP